MEWMARRKERDNEGISVGLERTRGKDGDWKGEEEGEKKNWRRLKSLDVWLEEGSFFLDRRDVKCCHLEGKYVFVCLCVCVYGEWRHGGGESEGVLFYTMFWICSRIFSSSSRMMTAIWETGASFALVPMVIASRLISWTRKLSF